MLEPCVKAYLHVGLKAYMTALPYRPHHTEDACYKPEICMAFLLFMSSTISLSRGPAFLRLMIGLDMLTFITKIYEPDKLEMCPVQLVLHALWKKLDPVDDALIMLRMFLSYQTHGIISLSFSFIYLYIYISACLFRRAAILIRDLSIGV